MSTSPRIPEDASEAELKALVAEALDAILAIEWCDGRLRVSIKGAGQPEPVRV